jgi:hypothetical protein
MFAKVIYIWLAGFCVLILLGALTGCSSTTYDLQSRSSATSEARGELVTRKAKGGMTEIEMRAWSLTRPDQVTMGAKQYVAWIKVPSEDQPQNVGSFFVGQNEKAEMETLVGYSDFEFFVTPEPTGFAPYPSGPAVFRTSVVR